MVFEALIWYFGNNEFEVDDDNDAI